MIEAYLHHVTGKTAAKRRLFLYFPKVRPHPNARLTGNEERV